MKQIFLSLFNSFKIQMLFYFCLMSILPSTIIWFYFYNSSKTIIENRIKDSNLKIVSQITENMEERVNEVNTFIESIYFNDNLTKILTSEQPSDVIDIKMAEIEMRKDIDYKFVYFPVTKYIQSIIFMGNNGVKLSYGPDSKAYELSVLNKEKWFRESVESNDGGTMWNGLINNYSKTSNSKKIIPLVKIIKDKYSNKQLGIIVILFNENVFKSLYDKILPTGATNLFIIGDKDTVISTNYDITNTVALEKKVQNLSNSKNNQYMLYTENDLKSMVISNRSSKYGWWVFEIIELDYIEQQKNKNLKTAIFLVAIITVSSVLFSIYLSQNFASPVKKLVGYVNNVAKGNFTQTININNKNELGILSQHIKRMSSDIQSLINKNITEEKEKREIEIKMLQSQINPHFLYNTLNIIKWMATVQGNDSIRDIVLSLGTLLKEAYEGVDEKILLADEIEIVNHYINIQRIRYKGRIKFSIDIQDENLMKSIVVKFTLQPLIENAIFHGIEPKHGMGEIKVYIREEDHKLIITVKDNGIGISKKKINQILAGDESEKSKNNKGIGLANVERRIKLFYGNEYGIGIESEEREFTSVTLYLPLDM